MQTVKVNTCAGVGARIARTKNASGVACRAGKTDGYVPQLRLIAFGSEIGPNQ